MAALNSAPDRSGEQVVLAGISVLELTDQLPGGYCGRLLAMLGADVIKIESPSRLDRSRAAGPFPGDKPHWERSGLYRYLHAQKRSLSLAVDTPSGFDLLRRLTASADVLLDDGALGPPSAVLARYAELMAANDRLIVNAFSSYGLHGPKAGWVSTELTELAASGWLRPRPEGAQPLMPGAPCAHYGVGTLGALGVLLALAARRRFGFGQLVETPINEALLSLLAFPTAAFSFSGSDGVRLGDGYPFAIFRCADGYLGVSLLTQRHWHGLCVLMGRQDLLTNPRFRTGAERAAPEAAAEITRLIGDWIADQPARATYEQAQALRVPIAIIPSPSEVLASPHYQARGYWIDDDDPELGQLRLPGHPFQLTCGGFAPFRRAPRFGAETAAVLESIGVPGPSQVALSQLGVI
jgi:crotonobetainyl-CoA:carnitine CoA-transferase CaiB-like acyl-CoA transferase